ncbi:MAG: hypothetical protein JWL73_132 [Actinomycetia bacterium]|nr:hypothetical protein [Actinomycetes bacterium]
MRFTQDVLGMAMTVAPLLLVVFVVIAMRRDREHEKAQEATLAERKAARRAEANAITAAAAQRQAGQPVPADTLEAPSNN